MNGITLDENLAGTDPNPEAKGAYPIATLTWVYRSDGSGTTAAFTNSMQAFSKKWKLGTGKSVAWPVGVGNKGNAGVAGVIRNTSGSIGYVNQSYIKGEVVAAALQNKNGEFVLSLIHISEPTRPY